MKTENSLVIIGSIQLMMISVYYWRSDLSTLDLSLHDTYYVIHIAFVQLFCLLLTIIDFVIYKRIRAKLSKVNTRVSLVQISTLIAFFLLVGVIWKELQNGFFPQIQLFSLALLFILSQLLLIIHFFLPSRKRKSQTLHSQT